MQAPAHAHSTNTILLREDVGPIAVLTLNRPQARNSLSEDLLAAMSDALTAVAADTSVRAVVIAANGSAFCAGHDMRELLAHRTGADGGRAYFAKLMDRCSSVMQAIAHLP
ncbi:MAG: enoyl-CoA hydratase/isomerase family protein, partial [Xanthobacteraceae bacterium]|nr:enoyl-CoA hydratase/isomerase family protein [Xanthobacteraceae bacterium]